MLSKDMEEECLAQEIGGAATTRRTELSTNDKFFHYFQEEVARIGERISSLHTTPTVAGEQVSAADYCLADISRLSDEVKNASTYIPSYDQRVYAVAIKSLQEKFADAKEAIAPRKRFAFKRSRQNTPIKNTTDEIMQDIVSAPSTPAPNTGPEPNTQTTQAEPKSSNTNMEPDAAMAVDGGDEGKQAEEEAAKEGEEQQQEEKEEEEEQPANAPVISYNQIQDSYIILPDSAPVQNISLSLQGIQQSVIDMSSIPETGRSFSTCLLRDACDSLLICGKVDGPAYISDVIDSVVVVTCHQFRMHQCSNVIVYLSCATNPIIEGCMDIKFSPLPEAFRQSGQNGKKADKWSSVEDFNWLRPEPSPNWSVLKDEYTVDNRVWGRILGDKQRMMLRRVLEVTGVTRLIN
ncbi:hypothetical protein MGYG_06047 [Nannizzia gypsea CBS 118893]|uniref:C-CAP/cofactor C-like domain-containing protein n=1 Tax=Arthroderma gypseum (strain ATCC MYA-4604 / CBS 118893) TaxID=535722 RepID=E4V0B2_ARTGP|nr:hypothetical protein MGYG_06047 [Nannizzia gypsea CBS 118893]EFR03049.1 hypothetical protein MGYG_06047 [Nannizzia gypsea CBS 118893]